MNTYRSSSSSATKKSGRELAKKLTAGKPADKAIVVALVGELGSGKTTFAQGFAAGLGVRGKTTSPTFILMRNSKLRNPRFKNFVHIDAYRADQEDFLKLGFKKLATDQKNVILIEWADRLKRIMPRSAIWVKFGHKGKKNERIIKMRN